MKNKPDLLFPLKSTSQVPAEEERFPSRAINVQTAGQYTQDHLEGGGNQSLSPRPRGRENEAQGRPSPLTRPSRPAQGHRRGREARRGTRAERGKEQGARLPHDGHRTGGRKFPLLRRELGEEGRERRTDREARPAGVCSAPARVVKGGRVPPESVPRRDSGRCPSQSPKGGQPGRLGEARAQRGRSGPGTLRLPTRPGTPDGAAPRPAGAARPLPQVAAGVVLVVVLGLRVPEQHGCSSAAAAPQAWQRSSGGPRRTRPVPWKPHSQPAVPASPAHLWTARGRGHGRTRPPSGRAAGRGPPEAAHLADPLGRALPGSERASGLRDRRGRRALGLGLRPGLLSRPREWGPGDPHRRPDDLPRFSRAPPSTLLRPGWVPTVAPRLGRGCPELGH